MQFKDGTFQHAGFIGHTKDKNLAVLSQGLLDKFKGLYDEAEYTVIELPDITLKACKYKMNAFADEQNAHVIAETKAYVYIVVESLGNIAWSSIQKMKRSELNTVGLRQAGIFLE